MGGADEEIGLSEVKDPIKDAEIVFFWFVDHVASSELGVYYAFGDVVEQHCLALQLPFSIVVEKDEESFRSVGALYQFILIVYRWEQSVAVEEDVVAVK